MERKVPPLLLTALLATAVYLSAPYFPESGVKEAFSLAVSLIVLTAGFLFITLGAYELRRYETTINPVNIEETSTLVTSGIYAISRNPIYVGLALCLTSLVIFLDAPILLCIPVFYVLYIHRYQIKPEEQVLLDKFGEQYRQYITEVRPWL